MRKLFCTTLIAAALGLGGTAIAGGTNDGLPGNQGCDLIFVAGIPGQDNVVKNPGKLFQVLRDRHHWNPKEITNHTIADDNLGDVIQHACDDPSV